MKLRIVETMASKTSLTNMIDKILGTGDFSLMRNEARFKWLLISRKQVNTELGVSLIYGTPKTLKCVLHNA